MIRGLSRLELWVGGVTAIAMGLIALPLAKSATLRAEVAELAAAAKGIHEALTQYYAAHRQYPETLQSLVREGHYDGSRLEWLGERGEVYDAPDDRGRNQEFWLELTPRGEPRLRFLVAHSDDAPLAAGSDCDGTYLVEDGLLVALGPS